MDNPAFSAREVLRRAWPLFQETLLRCLPPAIVAAAASAVPSAEVTASRSAGLPVHNAQWWGLLCASTVLVLICCDGIQRLQLEQADGRRLGILDALRRAVAGLPRTLVLMLFAFLPLLLPALWIALRGPGIAGALLLLLSAGGVLLLFFAWPALSAGSASPWAVVRGSIRMARAQLGQVMLLAGIVLAAVLVFALLTGILLGVVIMLAGPEAQSSESIVSLSRWLMAAVLAVPIVYVGAVSVAAYRMVAPQR